MTETLRARQAGESDIPTVVDMWNEAAAWLGRQGLDQWQYEIRLGNIENAVQSGSCWLFENLLGKAVATVTLDEEADPRLWQVSDDPKSALYVHRLVVRQEERGHELGSAILDWTAEKALGARKKWLRLDAWTSNSRLHDYYLRRGFRHLRTISGPGLVSGAVFERAASVQDAANPKSFSIRSC